MGFIRATGQACLFLGLLGLALVSVSAPLIPRLCFIRGHFEQSITLLLGLTGGCVQVAKSQTCPAAKLGYSITLDNFPGKTGGGPEPINPTLTSILVLFPIAAILALLAFVTSLFKRSRFAHYTSVTLVTMCFLASTAGLITALFSFIRALGRINDQFAPASPASLGPAIWIAIAAVVLIAFSGLLIASGPPKKSKSDGSSSTNSLKNAQFLHSKEDLCYAQPNTYQQQYGSYNKPIISDPTYHPHQGMSMRIDHQPANEGSYYHADGDDNRSIYARSNYSADYQPQYHASSYYGEQEMSGSRRQPSLRRSVSRNSNKSRR